MGNHQGVSEIIEQHIHEYEHFGLMLDYFDYQTGDSVGKAYQPIHAYELVYDHMDKAFSSVVRDLIGESFLYIVGSNSYNEYKPGMFESYNATVLGKMKITSFRE